MSKEKPDMKSHLKAVGAAHDLDHVKVDSTTNQAGLDAIEGALAADERGPALDAADAAGEAAAAAGGQVVMAPNSNGRVAAPVTQEQQMQATLAEMSKAITDTAMPALRDLGNEILAAGHELETQLATAQSIVRAVYKSADEVTAMCRDFRPKIQEVRTTFALKVNPEHS